MVGRLSYLRRTREERALFMRAAVYLVVCRLSLNVLSFGSTRRFLRLIARVSSSQVQNDGAALLKVQWAIRAAGRRMPWAVTCLTAAICTQALSDRFGEPTSLILGVGRDDVGEFRAHAWVESQGRVICGALSELPEFTLLTTLAGDAV